MLYVHVCVLLWRSCLEAIFGRVGRFQRRGGRVFGRKRNYYRWRSFRAHAYIHKLHIYKYIRLVIFQSPTQNVSGTVYNIYMLLMYTHVCVLRCFHIFWRNTAGRYTPFNLYLVSNIYFIYISELFSYVRIFVFENGFIGLRSNGNVLYTTATAIFAHDNRRIQLQVSEVFERKTRSGLIGTRYYEFGNDSGLRIVAE